ncbi:hypothetical protein FS749_008752 [Ceratobasidium sp. UAMH 11750]|nr:hypothetical protein FS749_008752 [Ceratobasidium sp. UAMH 11750]
MTGHTTMMHEIDVHTYDDDAARYDDARIYEGDRSKPTRTTRRVPASMMTVAADTTTE